MMGHDRVDLRVILTWIDGDLCYVVEEAENEARRIIGWIDREAARVAFIPGGMHMHNQRLSERQRLMDSGTAAWAHPRRVYLCEAETMGF